MHQDEPVRGRKGLGMAIVAGILVILTGGAWAFASPPGSSPDDNYHLSSIWCAWGTEASGCVVDPATKDTIRPRATIPALADADVACHKFDAATSAACQFDPATPPPEYTIDNGFYPHGFYAALRLLASDQADTSVILMRTVVFVFCVGLMAWAGWLLFGSNRYRVWLVWMAASVPLGIFLFASTNPSSVTIAGVAATGVAVYAGATGSGGRRHLGAAAGLAFVASVAALGSRTDASYFLVVAIAAGLCLMGAFWSRPWRALIPAVAAGIPTVLGLALIGVRGAAMAQSGLGVDPALPPPSVLEVAASLPRFVTGEYASTLGWFDVPMPATVWASVAFCVSGLMLLGLGAVSRGKAAGLLLTVSAASVIVITLQVKSSTQLQPRYILPLVLVAVALAVITPRRVTSWTFTRGQALIVAVLLSIAQSVAMLTTIQRYTVSVNGRAIDALTQPQWWWEIPLPPWAIWLVGSVAFAALVVPVAGASAKAESPEPQAEERDTKDSDAELTASRL